MGEAIAFFIFHVNLCPQVSGEILALVIERQGTR